MTINYVVFFHQEVDAGDRDPDELKTLAKPPSCGFMMNMYDVQLLNIVFGCSTNKGNILRDQFGFNSLRTSEKAPNQPCGYDKQCPSTMIE